ncbi:hypothetical protein L228DRAFT_271467 [Xylona heveae TC161]|uniref:Protein farnesyltransferase subunit beta n=1 Tax=Xylona heveae (strain CBS 132557 / TC161) TaxID=1328760 RepID=A0A164ZKR4_XYLHT|nr:hypothetical protein L228DRAFT_271467 [Xylona heveae TC161]KZF19217.1 hypothetical protein L228DRAFT_271467 [Xylona heveae TC161]
MDRDENKIEELSDTSAETIDASDEEDERLFGHQQHPTGADSPLVPPLFTSLPPIQDSLETETSQLQNRTIQECLPLLAAAERAAGGAIFDFNPYGLPRLDRERHVAFLQGSLGRLPSGFVAADASRPWMVYWALTCLYLLGQDLAQYREEVIATLTPMQNPDGGFGGGHGHYSHVAPSYAAVLSLVMVGGDEALNLIDRKAMWRWLGDLKQRDGGFQVCVGGEEDVRGAYCSMVIASLLNLPLELPSTSSAKQNDSDTLITGLREYLARCQTFEGGIADSPDNEAHGAFAFCALACLCLMDDPQKIINETLDVPRLISWLSSRQHAPEGGFAGRTNKLVDGCYSHWAGGCWPLIQAALDGPMPFDGPVAPTVGTIYSREGLTRYILCCCQGKRGGLRDKPSKHVDAYHSCYALVALSSTQHSYFYMGTAPDKPITPLTAAFHWASSPRVLDSNGEIQEPICDEEDRVKLIHPIFVIPWGVPETTRAWYEAKSGL